MAIAVIGTRGIPANYGGFETCAEQLTRRWVADGQDVLVFARRNPYVERPRHVHGARLCYVRALGRFGLETPSAALVSALILITRFSRYRWVHVYNTGSAIVVPLLRLFGFKVLVSVDGIEWNRDKWGALQKWAHRFGAWLSARFANRVIADNRVVQDVYRAQFGCEAALIAYGAEPIERHVDRIGQVVQVVVRFAAHVQVDRLDGLLVARDVEAHDPVPSVAMAAAASRPRPRSQMRSFNVSMPTDNRIVPGEMPAAASSASDS